MTIPTSLHDLLTTRGEILFVEFMHHALYAPDFGYYTTSFPQLGISGDFVTAPLLTPLFGQTLALQCLAILSELDNPNLFEFGAGTGQLCIDILTHLDKLNCLPLNYFILEVSGHLRDYQQALINKQIPHLANRIHWLSQWPKQPFSGVILANEVLDAMPVHRFLRDETGIYDSVIALNEQGELIEGFKPCTNPQLIDYVQQYIPADSGPYQSEVNFFLDGWLAECSAMLQEGVMFIIDYGFPRAEYYHPERKLGTLMCHHRHKAHANPLIHVGEKDITAHVDFSHVAEAADRAGFDIAGYTNQASFLLAAGLPSLLDAIDNEHERIKAVQAVKQLIQPHEMGELFKVMALTKNFLGDLQGFSLQDKRGSL